jgi:23S rRNA (adenine2030-N6)-methyltransferase
MFILNPPYTLLPTLKEVMPYLVKVLGKDAGATFVLESGTQLHGTSARLPAAGERRPPAVRGPLAGTGSLRLPGQAPAGTPVSKRPAARPAGPRGPKNSGSGRP